MFSVVNLNITAGSKKILRHINLDIKSGDLTAIIGPNGAGKSTLAKALTGLNLEKKKNEIFYHGINMHHFSKTELAKRRAFLSQKTNTAFAFPVEDIVSMGRFPYYNHVPSKFDKEKIREAIRFADIEHLINRSSETLSGGELQRVHFARVLAQCLDEPEKMTKKLLILDEPANNLDPKYQFELLDLVKRLSKTHRLTSVIVMHDLNQTALFADDVIVLNQGEFVAQGSPEEVLNESLLEEVYQIPFKVKNDENHLTINCFRKNIKEELAW